MPQNRTQATPDFIPADDSASAPDFIAAPVETTPTTRQQRGGMTPPPTVGIPAGATIRAADKPKGVAATIEQYAGDTIDDIRLGTDKTIVGKGLKALGARGTSSGNPEAVGDYMASLPLGAARVVKGHAEVAQPGKRWQGAKDIAGGTMQAVEMPLSLDVGGAAEEGAGAVSRAFPSKARAGRGFQEVMAEAKNVPVEVYGSGNTALRIKEMADAGATMPKVINRFLVRMTSPDAGPLTYKEARDFYENATRLSSEEVSRLTPSMRRMMGQFTAELKQEVGRAAETVGKRATYEAAMREYHQAAQLGRAGKKALKALPYAAGAAAGYEIAKNVIP